MLAPLTERRQLREARSRARQPRRYTECSASPLELESIPRGPASRRPEPAAEVLEYARVLGLWRRIGPWWSWSLALRAERMPRTRRFAESLMRSMAADVHA